MAGKYLHGALVQFSESFPLPIPNVIIFQYNPETMRHGWKPSQNAAATAPLRPSNPLAIRGSPQESFSFTLAMDAGEVIADGHAEQADLAIATGVQSRLAALEMLMFPAPPRGGGLVGTVSAALHLSAPAPKRSVPAAVLPMVLFVWGPGRILPVRVASLEVTETLYDSLLLNPTHAQAQIELTVLTKEELALVRGSLSSVARAASSYTQRLRQTLALANLDNAVESVIGMLPV
jgi:hypothetical protein